MQPIDNKTVEASNIWISVLHPSYSVYSPSSSSQRVNHARKYPQSEVRLNLKEILTGQIRPQEIARLEKFTGWSLNENAWGDMHSSGGYRVFKEFYQNMAKDTGQKLLEINSARINSETKVKTLQLELLNSNNLLSEQQIKNNLSDSCILELKRTQVDLVKKLEQEISEKNEIEIDSEKYHLELENCKVDLESEKTIVAKQKSEIDQLKRSNEELIDIIKTLRQEKISQAEEFATQIKAQNEIHLKDRLKFEQTIIDNAASINGLIKKMLEPQSRSNSVATSDNDEDERFNLFSYLNKISDENRLK